MEGKRFSSGDQFEGGFGKAYRVTACPLLFAMESSLIRVQFQINPEVTTVHFYGDADESVKGDLFRHFASVEAL